MKREEQERSAKEVEGWDCNQGRPHSPTPATPGAALEPKPWGYDLWKHMNDEHGLVLLENEVAAIVRLAREIPLDESAPQPAKSQVTPSDSTGGLPPAWAVKAAHALRAVITEPLEELEIPGLREAFDEDEKDWAAIIARHAPPPVSVSPPCKERLLELTNLFASDEFHALLYTYKGEPFLKTMEAAHMVITFISGAAAVARKE